MRRCAADWASPEESASFRGPVGTASLPRPSVPSRIDIARIRRALSVARDRTRVATSMLGPGRAVTLLIHGTLPGGAPVSLFYSGSARYVRDVEWLVSEGESAPRQELLFRGSLAR